MADSEGLSREQFRLLLLVAIGIGAVLLLAIIGVTAASVVWGTGGGGGAPTAAFEVQTIDRSDGVAANVSHAGGDAVNPESIVVEVNGEPRGTWTELGGQGPDIVARGHQLVLDDVAPGDSIAVVWTGDDERVELGRGTIRPG
ncbi:hypothetical protein L593_02250 [Salinarchaeum sp. Harcht-Bsk1]|uniref:type IV pilin n=1 Tax=Salinarchaeum sp. Harcht-Bsk1 TaxID=1333523 RepID=UPI0003423E55|nr:type IV pilin [Salinarchaeum sp. Harcht-Bsk1]AGN00401.1 hypothetical protein L593_02250 [Salinarchaeum sp. Harcht-Bsk1]